MGPGWEACRVLLNCLTSSRKVKRIIGIVGELTRTNKFESFQFILPINSAYEYFLEMIET